MSFELSMAILVAAVLLGLTAFGLIADKERRERERKSKTYRTREMGDLAKRHKFRVTFASALAGDESAVCSVSNVSITPGQVILSYGLTMNKTSLHEEIRLLFQEHLFHAGEGELPPFQLKIALQDRDGFFGRGRVFNVKSFDADRFDWLDATVDDVVIERVRLDVEEVVLGGKVECKGYKNAKGDVLKYAPRKASAEKPS